jgi:hypothetical protein
MSTTRFRLHHMHLLGLMLLCIMLLALGLPGAVITQAAGNGEDYATNELGDPWDMDGPGDIAFEYTRDKGHLSGLTFNNGLLEATATSFADPRITLRLPTDPHTNPVPQDGTFHPIDASKYKYLTVRLNVPINNSAQVFWQAATGTPFGISGLKAVSAGWNTITFDLTSGTSGAPWSGSIAGLYFDPMNAAGAFKIDYVRLSTAIPTSPDNIPPQLSISSPSFISGPDYATTVMNDPWDMSESTDITTQYNTVGGSFSGGVYSATNANGNFDPGIMLHVATPINTSRFKYMTYRMKLDGQFNTDTGGSVSRILWWTTIPQEASITNDIVVYEGYQVVSFDLNKIKLEAGSPTWASGAPKVFRLDPHEFTTQRTFHVDYVMLTGDSTANSSFDIRYQTRDGDGVAPSPQFFFDNNASGFNGTAISCANSASAAAVGGGFNVFLPLITYYAPLPPVSPTGSTCTWNTSNVPNGTYYIYGLVSDGTDTARIYSQTPVVVSH